MLGTLRRLAITVAWFWALGLLPGAFPALARSAEGPTGDPAFTPATLTGSHQPVPGRSRTRENLPPRGETTSGWWLGPVGITAALAVVGGISLASKRFNLNLNLGLGMNRELGPIGVVGQTRLTPKQAVHLVRVGDRVLIVGTGPAGSPTPLGEVTDPTELSRLIPRRVVRPGAVAPVVVAGASRSSRFDRQIGDDE